jgi:hypothetical protein
VLALSRHPTGYASMFDSTEQDEALLKLLTALNDAMWQFKKFNALKDSDLSKEYERTLLKRAEQRVFQLHRNYREKYELHQERRLVSFH